MTPETLNLIRSWDKRCGENEGQPFPFVTVIRSQAPTALDRVPSMSYARNWRR